MFQEDNSDYPHVSDVLPWHKDNYLTTGIFLKTQKKILDFTKGYLRKRCHDRVFDFPEGLSGVHVRHW